MRSTRERIEEEADALFYKAGFEATSFADIADAVGISRGNFYHHFKSKDQILEAVIDRRLSTTRTMLEEWDAGASPRDRIISFIRILLKNKAKIMAYGCPVGTLATELAKLDHAAQGRAADVFVMFRDWLVRQFKALGISEESERLALHLLARTQGAAVMASTFRDNEFLKSEVKSLERWLDRCVEQPAARS